MFNEYVADNDFVEDMEVLASVWSRFSYNMRNKLSEFIAGDNNDDLGDFERIIENMENAILDLEQMKEDLKKYIK